MKILGISEGYHDAGVSVIDDTKIIHASHSERYSRIKNDKWAAPEQLVQADTIAYYEDPELKNKRREFAGQVSLIARQSMMYTIHIT